MASTPVGRPLLSASSTMASFTHLPRTEDLSGCVWFELFTGLYLGENTCETGPDGSFDDVLLGFAHLE